VCPFVLEERPMMMKNGSPSSSTTKEQAKGPGAGVDVDFSIGSPLFGRDGWPRATEIPSWLLGHNNS
jgi:hypothetical protein